MDMYELTENFDFFPQFSLAFWTGVGGNGAHTLRLRIRTSMSTLWERMIFLTRPDRSRCWLRAEFVVEIDSDKWVLCDRSKPPGSWSCNEASGLGENWSTHGSPMLDSLPEPEKEEIETDPASERLSWSGRISMLEAKLDSDGGDGSTGDRGVLDFDWSSRVTPSTSISARICWPSVGMRAMMV